MVKTHGRHQRILIINIFGIGDVLFTTPLISNIKAGLPGSFLGYVCNKRAADVLAGNPKVDKIFVYEKDEYRGICRESKINFLGKIIDSLNELKKERFDTVIDLSLNKYSSFLMRLIKIPQRIGFNYKNRSPFLTTKIRLEGYEEKHVVEYYLDMLNYLGLPAVHKKLEINLSGPDKQWTDALLKDYAVKTNDCVVGIVPGGGASWGTDAVYKRWPAEKYAQLADKIIENFHAKVILMGNQNEASLCQDVQRAMTQKFVHTCKGTTLGQFAALLSRCRLAVVNDGGPLHVAVAVGTKTVSIFGPVDERVYGPYPGGHHAVVMKDIACRPCYRRFKMADCEHHNCLNSIGVDEVLEKVRQMI